MPTFACPTCQRPVEWSPASPWRPFCSERCRLIDLGAWMNEQHAIPGEQLAEGHGEQRPESDDTDHDDPRRH